ncbi:MAG: hypothetical protein L3J41_15235 [Melioribacteraceae bacterium]|nr:hypothetical protein [Melioribacteraceae bacterium]
MIKNIAGLFLFIIILVGFSNMFAQVDSVEIKYYPFELSDSTSSSEIIEKQPYKDPTRSKLFMAPTAKNLEAFSGMVGLYAFIIPYANLGITDRISIGSFLFPLPFNSSVAFNGQVNVYSNNPYDIATGVFYFHSLKNSGVDSYFLYGVATTSTNNRMVNILSGFNPLTKNYFISIGGEIKVADEIKIVTDNWYFSSDENNIFFSLGLRFFEESYSFDLGAVVTKITERDFDNNQIKSEFKMAGIGVWIGFAIYF